MAEIAVALDLAAADDALRLVERIGDAVVWYKVGPVLYVAEGPGVVRELLARGKRVFLDLKWHDIPSTVGGAVAAAGALGAGLATVHLSGGVDMLRAAAVARPSGLRLVGVGVLTSLTAEAFAGVLGRGVTDLSEEMLRLAKYGLAAGLDGFVCAAREARGLRRLAGPEAMLVVPGIRRTGDAADDQARAATPREAVGAGADLLVIGRPITSAPDPRRAVVAIREEMAG